MANRESAGGMGVFIQAHDEQYQAAMRRAAQTARQTGAQIAQSFQGASFDQFGRRMDIMFTGLAGRFRLLARDLRSFSASLSVVSGFGAYLSGRAFINTAGEFEQKMEIIKTLAGATTEEMRALEQQTVQLGASTARTANEVAGGALELQKMGRSIADIQQILPAVTNFSIASDRTVAESAHTAGAVLMQFRLAASETTHVMDVLTRGANRSAADVGDFSIALTYAGQQAFNANISLERTIALMEAASNAGIPGSRLGTGLQSVLNDIYMPNMRQIQLFHRFGIETRDAEGHLRDLYDVMQDIFTKLPQNQWSRFEVDTQNFLMALRGQGIGALRAAERDLTTSATGETSRTAEARMRGMKGALDALGGAFDSLLIKIGESGLTAALTKLFRDIGSWVQSLGQLGANTMGLVAAFAALALALNPVMFLIGSMLTILTSPEGLIFALISAGAAATAWSALQAEIKGVENAMRSAHEPMANIAEINARLATATGETADNLRRQRDEMIQTLSLQAQTAAAEAARLEARRDFMRGVPGGLTSGAVDMVHGWFGESDDDKIRTARAEADRLAQLVSEIRDQSDRRDGVRTLRTGPRAGMRVASTSSIASPASGAAPPLPVGDPNDILSMSATASIQRQTAALEAQARAAQENYQALARMAGIQQIIEQSRDFMGGVMSESEATGIFDRQQRAQDAIQLAAVRAESAETIQTQNDLTVAMQHGERAYDRARIAIELLRQNMGMTAEEAANMAAQQEAATHQFGIAQERMQRFAQMYRDIGDTIAGAFEKAVMEGGKLSDVLKGLARDILLIAFRAAVVKPLGESLGRGLQGLFGFGGGGGGFDLGQAASVLAGGNGIVQGDGANGLTRMLGSLGRPGGWMSVITSIFGGGRATGGPVWAGMPYSVGEKGRELFVPQVNGRIMSVAEIAAGGRGGGGASAVYAPVYNLTGTSEEIAAVRRQAAEDRKAFRHIIRAELGNINDRGRGWSG